MKVRLGWIAIMIGAVGFVSCGGDEGTIVTPSPVPAEYADKHMPEGWWTDPKILEEGKAIYEGRMDRGVNCTSCHGMDGEPQKRGARDFRVAERMKLSSDSYLFWRVSEGVPKTRMRSWKSKLSEEDRWKVIAYLHRFSHGGNPASHDDYRPSATEAAIP